MLDKQDQMLDKQEPLIGKQDETTERSGPADRSEGPHRHEVCEDRDGPRRGEDGAER
jgi:hypothetical protein